MLDHHTEKPSIKMAGKADYWSSWPVLLGVSFFSGVAVGYLMRTRKGVDPSEERCSEIEVISIGHFLLLE